MNTCEETGIVPGSVLTNSGSKWMMFSTEHQPTIARYKILNYEQAF